MPRPDGTSGSSFLRTFALHEDKKLNELVLHKAIQCLALLLSTLETTIIVTALIAISSSLGDFGKSNWIVIAYLLTYTGTSLQSLAIRNLLYCIT